LGVHRNLFSHFDIGGGCPLNGRWLFGVGHGECVCRRA
jgi:hypothetical protein